MFLGFVKSQETKLLKIVTRVFWYLIFISGSKWNKVYILYFNDVFFFFSNTHNVSTTLSSRFETEY